MTGEKSTSSDNRGPYYYRKDESGIFYFNSGSGEDIPLRGRASPPTPDVNIWFSKKPIDISLLPKRPSFQRSEAYVQEKRLVLDDVVFEPGYDFVTEDVFNAAKELEASWRSEYLSAARYTENHIDQIWTRIESLPLERLNSQDDIHHVNNVCLDQEDLDDLAKLRTLYPELHMLSDLALNGLYDSYQQDIHYVGSYEIYRTDDFLYYLFGRVFGPEGTRRWACEVGKFFCYALLKGNPLEEAISFGKSVNDYEYALSTTTHRIRAFFWLPFHIEKPTPRKVYLFERGWE